MDNAITTTEKSTDAIRSALERARATLKDGELMGVLTRLSALDDKRQPGGSKLLRATTDETVAWIDAEVAHAVAWRGRE
jgi:hypothetical protein